MSETASLMALCGTAATVGFLHTVAGPDHYLPFVAMAKARDWSLARTSWITFFCGIGHVLSSVVLGLVGVAAGIAVSHVEGIEGFRGNIAGWALLGFGLVYMVWGIRRGYLNKPHKHPHIHVADRPHDHEHVHASDHAHVHEKEGKRSITPWIPFTVFVLGPCEPLIPLLMYPAAMQSAAGMALVAGIFSVITISTMMTIIALMVLGIARIRVAVLERWSHALAGGAILLCGVAVTMGL
jgi:nickel/cobalt transporter (NicO) family protein